MIKLSDGTEFEIDLYKLTVSEVRTLLDNKKKEDDGDAILAKAVGMTAKQIASLPFPDYRKITRAFWQAIRNPLADEETEKNSLSESTSP